MGFRAVLLDHRGTLVPAPTYPGLVRDALTRLGRAAGRGEVAAVLGLLRGGDASLARAPDVDADAARHRAAYDHWFRTAGIDGELAAALYAVESDVTAAPFAHDAGEVLAALAAAGVAIGIVSDRPLIPAKRSPTCCVSRL